MWQMVRRLRRTGESAMRLGSRRWLQAAMRKRQRVLDNHDLSQRAIVFAPHEDDEVLGCGGTILRKRRLGADVAVVFMTDGSGSHPGLMPADEMKELRAAEARAACSLLGVD